MNSILKRRRALISNQWEDITNHLSFVNWTNAGHEISGNNIRVYSLSDGQYRNIRADFSTSDKYIYKYTVDGITVSTGVALIGCWGVASIVSATSSGQITNSSGPIEKTFNHNSNISKINLYCTFTEEDAGDVTYHNFKLWRKRL